MCEGWDGVVCWWAVGMKQGPCQAHNPLDLTLGPPWLGCALCAATLQAFAGSAELRVHRAGHAGIKLFNCPVEGCEKKFSDRSGLRYHKKAVHSGERPYPCTIPGCGACCVLKHTSGMRPIPPPLMRGARGVLLFQPLLPSRV